LTSSPPDELRGVQTPRIESVPDYVSTSGHEAVELCAAFGVHLDPWQQHVLIGALGERPDGKWSAFEVATIVSRQNGKGEILLARQLAGLFLLGEHLIMHSAHEYKTAAEAFLRIRAVVENYDELRKMVKTVRTSHGEEGIELRERPAAAVHGPFQGLGPWLHRRLHDLGRGIRPRRRGSGGDAADPERLQDRQPAGLVRLQRRPGGLDPARRRARARDLRGLQGLAYYEWSADPRADSDDRQAWAQANPAMGIRINAEHVERERAAMPELEFRRERLGIWDDAATNAVIPFDVWDQQIDRTSQPLDPVTFAIDISPTARRPPSASARAGRTASGTSRWPRPTWAPPGWSTRWSGCAAGPARR
jgi:phage terminase large subunit-like protein